MTQAFERYYDYYDQADHSSLVVAHYYAPKWASSAAELAAYQSLHPEAIIHPYGGYVPSISRNLDYQTIPVKKFDDPKAPCGSVRTRTRYKIISCICVM